MHSPPNAHAVLRFRPLTFAHVLRVPFRRLDRFFGFIIWLNFLQIRFIEKVWTTLFIPNIFDKKEERKPEVFGVGVYTCAKVRGLWR